MNGRRGPRGLNPADSALWGEITKSIKPLRERQTKIPADEASVVAPHERTRPLEPSWPQSAPKTSPPLATLDRRTRKRVARGRTEIDERIDLHGFTLERARARLSAFLLSAQGRGASLVLVITGKGGTAGGGRGALRREVPQWLSLPEFRSLVIGFEEAAAAHGGSGALYVRVRRSRS